MESTKARPRREREGFFTKYIDGKQGIDIGAGHDPLTLSCRTWDKVNGDAHSVAGVSNLDYVYSSHCLEHLHFPEIAIRNWWTLLKSGGYLIVAVPHRDLYEKKNLLPSRFNGDHKFFFLPDRDEAPCTYGLLPLARRALGDTAEFVSMKTCDEGWTLTPPHVHSGGEYSIELVLRKP